MRWRRGQAGPEERITRRWARRGTRPAAPRDQRTVPTASSAPSARRRKGAALVLPARGTAAMSPHLGGIGAMAGPGQHAVPLLGQAGWPPPATSPCRTADRTNGHIGRDWREWV